MCHLSHLIPAGTVTGNLCWERGLNQDQFEVIAKLKVVLTKKRYVVSLRLLVVVLRMRPVGGSPCFQCPLRH